ncbi:hypothetical protein RON44_05320 [Lactobacillus gasseri]|uniref:hypothetical protein n=1 Tax=Lactobacillus gasseri TaxID=1596 RepID=UPI0022AC697E|nr:hypothetical protein [Lactobacillus gasseri]MCZ3760957.1 hypothetical protein [Lactobacillus gasseri]MCZ3762740.1 hypothetical protein [Lactobacillus gasseri]MCZ3766247.1 hypothetical protein [Lactobacillus gasseri]MCZ3768012.1 hypothetical protein [Lactobacillus gasseri]MCZ3771504.1 hypothetical protein [Lactobacillus gasseri]
MNKIIKRKNVQKNHLYEMIRLGVPSSTYARYRTSKLATQKGIIDSTGKLITFKNLSDINLQLARLDSRKYYMAHSDFEDDFNEDGLRRYQYEDFDFVIDKKELIISIEHNEYSWQLVFKNIFSPSLKELSKLADLSTNKLGLNILVTTGISNSKMCVDLVFRAVDVDRRINVDHLVDLLFYRWNKNMFELCSIIERSISKEKHKGETGEAILIPVIPDPKGDTFYREWGKLRRKSNEDDY